MTESVGWEVWRFVLVMSMMTYGNKDELAWSALLLRLGFQFLPRQPDYRQIELGCVQDALIAVSSLSLSLSVGEPPTVGQGPIRVSVLSGRYMARRFTQDIHATNARGLWGGLDTYVLRLSTSFRGG